MTGEVILGSINKRAFGHSKKIPVEFGFGFDRRIVNNDRPLDQTSDRRLVGNLPTYNMSSGGGRWNRLWLPIVVRISWCLANIASIPHHLLSGGLNEKHIAIR
jgi:hypothetical protein